MKVHACEAGFRCPYEGMGEGMPVCTYPDLGSDRIGQLYHLVWQVKACPCLGSEGSPLGRFLADYAKELEELACRAHGGRDRVRETGQIRGGWYTIDHQWTELEARFSREDAMAERKKSQRMMEEFS